MENQNVSFDLILIKSGNDGGNMALMCSFTERLKRLQNILPWWSGSLFKHVFFFLQVCNLKKKHERISEIFFYFFKENKFLWNPVVNTRTEFRFLKRERKSDTNTLHDYYCACIWNGLLLNVSDMICMQTAYKEPRNVWSHLPNQRQHSENKVWVLKALQPAGHVTLFSTWKKKMQDKHAYQPDYRERYCKQCSILSQCHKSHYFEDKNISKITVTQKDDLVLLISLDNDIEALVELEKLLLLPWISRDFRTYSIHSE